MVYGQSKQTKEGGKDAYRKNLLQLIAIQEADGLEQASEGLDANRRNDAGSIDVDKNRYHKVQETSNNFRL